MGRLTSRRDVVKLTEAGVTNRRDSLAVEEPLEIRAGGRQFAVTMRTPGSDIELVQGFLLTEGIIGNREDIRTIRYCDGVDDEGLNTYNVVDIDFAARIDLDAPNLQRNLYVSSSCGVCGKASLDAVRATSRFAPENDWTISAGVLASMPPKLRGAQRIFASTGGLHAAGLFTFDGELLAIREDVGRHNAVDKVLGWALEQGRLPLRRTALLVSGRASFELVQKATMAAVPCLAAVSAPSSLAADLAEESQMTLVGFLRGNEMNIYTHAGHVVRP